MREQRYDLTDGKAIPSRIRRNTVLEYSDAEQVLVASKTERRFEDAILVHPILGIRWRKYRKCKVRATIPEDTTIVNFGALEKLLENAALLEFNKFLLERAERKIGEMKFDMCQFRENRIGQSAIDCAPKSAYRAVCDKWEGPKHLTP